MFYPCAPVDKFLLNRNLSKGRVKLFFYYKMHPSHFLADGIHSQPDIRPPPRDSSGPIPASKASRFPHDIFPSWWWAGNKGTHPAIRYSGSHRISTLLWEINKLCYINPRRHGSRTLAILRKMSEHALPVICFFINNSVCHNLHSFLFSSIDICSFLHFSMTFSHDSYHPHK